MMKELLAKYGISSKASIIDAMKKIDLNSGVALLVCDNGILVGTVSDGDIRRGIISNIDVSSSVADVMNVNPTVVYEKDYEEADFSWDNYEGISCVPIVDVHKRIKRVLVRKNYSKVVSEADYELLKDSSVVIMAGGKGTRLYPYTKILPKPLIPIGDIPIVERIIGEYTKYGIKDISLTVNYKKNMIKSYFDDVEKKYNLSYIEETMPLGTAGSLKLIEREFSKPLFVANCDILVNADYADIYKHHVDSGSEMTIVAALKQIVVPYGVIQSEEDGIISSMEEKPNLSYFVNTGMYIINPKCIDEIPKNEIYHMPQLAEHLMARGKKVTMYPVSEESFLDMGEFKELGRMEEHLNIDKQPK